MTQLVFLRPPQYAFPPAIGRRGRDHIFDVVERAPRDRAMMIIIKKSCCCGRAAAVCCAPEFGITPGIIVRAKIYSPIRLQIQRNESDFRDSPHSLPPAFPSSSSSPLLFASMATNSVDEDGMGMGDLRLLHPLSPRRCRRMMWYMDVPRLRM